MANGNGPGSMTPEDKDRLAEMLDPGTLTNDKRGFSLGVWRDLRDAESAGDESAERIVDALGCDGAFRALDKHAKRPTGLFKDADSGQVLNVPKIGSIPVRSDDGTSTGERQLKLWQEMTRSEFVAWIKQQRHHAESLRLKTRGLQRIVTLWDQYPDAETARDVCELAGIDPDDFEFGERSA